MRALPLLLLGLAACGGAGAHPRPSPRQIVRAGGLVNPGDAWPAAYLRLQDRLGPPTRIDGRVYSWAARIGDDCYLIEIATEAGVVTYVDDPYRHARHRGDPYARCAAAAP